MEEYHIYWSGWSTYDTPVLSLSNGLGCIPVRPKNWSAEISQKAENQGLETMFKIFIRHLKKHHRKNDLSAEALAKEDGATRAVAHRYRLLDES